MKENYKRILTFDRILTTEELTALGVIETNVDKYKFDLDLHTTRVLLDVGCELEVDMSL